ncbi:MAG: hypothetical protein H6699_04850 [Myxococcales bacterium]|nr:hypothetical protein [Myxococcales bacterium]
MAVPDTYPAQPEPNFHDTVGVRFGASVPLQIQQSSLTPRVGLAWEPTPTPEQTGLHNYLDNDRLITAAGLGFAHGVFTVDAAYQLHDLFRREHTKSACVANEDGVVDLPPEDGADISPTYPNPNPGCPSVSHGGLIHVVSVELGVAF